MANLSITATAVVAGTDAVTEVRPAGAALTAGQVVYLDTATDTYKLADADGAAALRSPRGICLNGAAIGQPVTIIRAGTVTIGATLTGGIAYALSATAGAICPMGDLTTGAYPAFLGIATSTTVLKVNITESGLLI